MNHDSLMTSIYFFSYVSFCSLIYFYTIPFTIKICVLSIVKLMISQCKGCHQNVSRNLRFWTYFSLSSNAAKVLNSSKNAVITQQTNQVKQQYILTKKYFLNFSSFYKVLVGLKNTYSKVTIYIPLTHLNLQRRSINRTPAVAPELFPLLNSGTKLSLIFEAYLYSVASNVSPQGERETKKAFCDFINFT